MSAWSAQGERGARALSRIQGPMLRSWVLGLVLRLCASGLGCVMPRHVIPRCVVLRRLPWLPVYERYVS